jgi:hypothetical protein
MLPRHNSQGKDQNMGHFSVKIYASLGSTLSDNQLAGSLPALSLPEIMAVIFAQ